MATDPAIETIDEFRGEYELELENWLHRRFRRFCGTLFAIELISLALWVLDLAGVDETAESFDGGGPGSALGPTIVVTTIAALSTVVLEWFSFRTAPRLREHDEIVKAASVMIVFLGTLDLVAMVVLDSSSGLGGLVGLYFLHFVSSLFLPWRPADSIRPMIPLLSIWLFVTIVRSADSNSIALAMEILLSPVGLLPGLAVCGLRMWHWRRRFRSAAVARGFGMLRREVKQARRIHESLFPEPIAGEGFRFEFDFQPMQDLGGDFVHASRTPDGRVRVVLIDVTGHGLSAAMTVTRMSGELERLVAEHPDIGPAAVLVALNRYTNLVLSQHSIFATAIAAELDPSDGTLRTANAGHPPGFLRRSDGRVETIEEHGLLLGAVSSDEFECVEHRDRLEPDDVLVLYTDGVTEVRDRNGTLFGVRRLLDALHRRPAPRSWARFVTSLVDAHRIGPPEDDVLVATLSRTGEDASSTAGDSSREATG